MNRALLLFLIIICIKLYPQESIIVDSVQDKRPSDLIRHPDKSFIRDSVRQRSPVIENIPPAPPSLIIIRPVDPGYDRYDRPHGNYRFDGEYFDTLDDNEFYGDEYYEDGSYEDFYYDYDDGVKGFGLSFLKCAYFDKNIFNLNEKIKLDPGYAISVMLHVTKGEDNAAFDFKAAYQPIRFHDNGFSSYDLYLLSFGLRYRKNFGNEDSYPYLLGCIYYNKGYFFNGGEDPVTFKTYTIGAGAGYNIYVNNRISFALEGTYETGFGWWDDYPSINSTGTSINPSNLNFRIILGVNF